MNRLGFFTKNNEMERKGDESWWPDDEDLEGDEKMMDQMLESQLNAKYQSEDRYDLWLESHKESLIERYVESIEGVDDIPDTFLKKEYEKFLEGEE